MTPQWPDPLASSIWRVVDGRGPTRRMVGRAKARVVCSIYAREASDEITLSFPQSYPLSLLFLGSALPSFSCVRMRGQNVAKVVSGHGAASFQLRYGGPPLQPSGIHDE